MRHIAYVLVAAIMTALAGYPLVEAAGKIATEHTARLERATAAIK